MHWYIGLALILNCLVILTYEVKLLDIINGDTQLDLTGHAISHHIIPYCTVYNTRYCLMLYHTGLLNAKYHMLTVILYYAIMN